MYCTGIDAHGLSCVPNGQTSVFVQTVINNLNVSTAAASFGCPDWCLTTMLIMPSLNFATQVFTKVHEGAASTNVIFVLIYVLVLVFQLFFSFSFVLVLQYFFVLVSVLPTTKEYQTC